MADHFLTKTPVVLSQCIEVNGALALDLHATLNEFLTDRAGPDTARLFAEPLVSRGNDQASSTVSWYCEMDGTGRPISSLDPVAQEEVGARLKAALAPLRDLVDDPEAGPLVAAALHLRSEADIWVVNGVPLLLNWGMLPEGLAVADTKGRAAHYAATLGRYLPIEGGVPLNQEERASRQPGPAAAIAGGAAAAAATQAAAAKPADAAPAPVVAAASSPDTGADGRRLPLASWLPLLLLLLVAGGILAWLLMPATRIFPTVAGQAIPDAAALRLAEDTNRALEQRLADLNVALDGAVCRADGTLLMPDGYTIEGLLPPDPANPADGPGTAVAAVPQPALPPDPARTVVSGESGDQASLLDLIETRTLFVWVSELSGGSSSGTGFFVGPDLVVTNYHVVANASPDGIFVTNKALGRVERAELVKTIGPLDEAGADFALLRVPGVAQPSFDILQSGQSLRLQSVIAAGYPGDVLQSDMQFAALRAGDANAVPELTVTDGSVNTEQQLSERTNALVHSATISTGNSGGPLIDMCGRLVGVNTYVVQGPLRNLNVALAAGDLLGFLAGEGAESRVVSDPCQPVVRRPMPPPNEAADAKAATVPALRP